MKLDIFLSQYTVFTFEEVKAFLSKPTVTKTSTIYNILAYHQKQGHIIRIRRGLYHVVPKGIDPDNCPIDAFLVASKMANDAVLGYSSALDLFGKLHTIRNEFIYISNNPANSIYDYRNVRYRKVSTPSRLKRLNKENFGLTTVDRLGQKILTTSLERTLVDVLDRPSLCGSWEEIWRSLESIEYVNIDKILEYALLLGNASTIAKLGFFLETHRQSLFVPDQALEQLYKYRPKKAHYLEKGKKVDQKLLSKWNIIIPSSFLYRQWDEHSQWDEYNENI